jgi:hypothetical protein
MTLFATALTNQRLPAAPIGIARLVIGIGAFLAGLEALIIAARVFESGSLRIPYSAAPFHLSDQALGALVLSWLMFAAAFAAGFMTRATGLGLALTMGLVLSSDQRLYSNHFYLLALIIFLLTLADCGASRSLDARRKQPRTSVPAWPLFLLKAQLTMVYSFAALTKIGSEYLSGDVLTAFFHFDRVPFLRDYIAASTLFAALAILSIATELFLAVALWSPRWRKLGLIVAVLFHASIVVLMSGGNPLALTNFGIMMICLNGLFYTLPPLIFRADGATLRSAAPLAHWLPSSQSLDPAAD